LRKGVRAQPRIGVDGDRAADRGQQRQVVAGIAVQRRVGERGVGGDVLSG